MSENRCPRCGWPLADLPPADSTHPVSAGNVSYRRCVCGTWLTQVNGTVVGATGSARSR